MQKIAKITKNKANKKVNLQVCFTYKKIHGVCIIKKAP